MRLRLPRYLNAQKDVQVNCRCGTDTSNTADQHITGLRIENAKTYQDSIAKGDSARNCRIIRLRSVIEKLIWKACRKGLDAQEPLRLIKSLAERRAVVLTAGLQCRICSNFLDWLGCQKASYV